MPKVNRALSITALIITGIVIVVEIPWLHKSQLATVICDRTQRNRNHQNPKVTQRLSYARCHCNVQLLSGQSAYANLPNLFSVARNETVRCKYVFPDFSVCDVDKFSM